VLAGPTESTIMPHNGQPTERPRMPRTAGWENQSRATMLSMPDPESRAAQRDLVRRGYDAISLEYRTDLGQTSGSNSDSTSTYRAWIDDLASRLRIGARVLDIGCGAGVPADQFMIDAGLEVTGVDISPVQIDRARLLVPQATFVCCDIVEFALEPQSFDAIVSLYTLIHIPLEDQRELLSHIFAALRPAGLLLAIVGHQHWTGVEDYLGAPMFWEHADTDTNLAWLREDRFRVLWHRYVPEGDVGHTLLVAQRP
jgi:SAM-dependent methyltransferase